jgi:NitT/TauT family transport system substrate-binding protein
MKVYIIANERQPFGAGCERDVSPMAALRMNQGDPTEARIYFIPHFVARSLRLFEKYGVEVSFIWSPPGDHLAKSGQIPAVLRGDADLTIGGPMVTMRMQAEGTAHLMNFCASVRTNPWYIVTRKVDPAFEWSHLSGKSVFDIAKITTASLVFRWLLERRGLAGKVEVIEGSGDEATDLLAFLSGRHDYAIHSLHALAPLIAEGRVAVATDLAGPTGAVPWSAYIALPEMLAARRGDFAAFASAIGEALAWIDTESAESIAALVAPDFPGYPIEGLRTGIALYKQICIWPTSTAIARADFEHFQNILRAVGWFERQVRYEDQVLTGLAA